MEKINTVDDLRKEIASVRIKHANNGLALKDQFRATYESLRPINLIKNTLKDLTSSPDLKGDLLGSGLSIGAGYLTRKVITGATHNPIRHLMGTLLQLGVTSVLSKNGDSIKSGVFKLLSRLLSKKKTTEEVQEEDDEIVTHV